MYMKILERESVDVYCFVYLLAMDLAGCVNKWGGYLGNHGGHGYAHWENDMKMERD